jgi:hypothetical protein
MISEEILTNNKYSYFFKIKILIVKLWYFYRKLKLGYIEKIYAVVCLKANDS